MILRLLDTAIGRRLRTALAINSGELAEELTDMCVAVEDRQQFLTQVLRFHGAIAEAAGNTTLSTFVDIVSVASRQRSSISAGKEREHARQLLTGA